MNLFRRNAAIIYINILKRPRYDENLLRRTRDHLVELAKKAISQIPLGKAALRIQ